MKNNTFPTLDKVVAITKSGRDHELNDIALFEVVCDLLAKFEGKPITQRFVTALKEHFGPNKTYCVMTHLNIGIPSIALYGPNIPNHTTYEDRFTFFLPCHDKSRLPFTVANLRLENGCFGDAARKRLEERNADLRAQGRLSRAAIAIDNYLAAKAELTGALAGLEDRYAIEAEFKLRD